MCIAINKDAGNLHQTVGLFRSTYSYGEVLADYTHSHVSGIARGFSSFCMGSSELGTLIGRMCYRNVGVHPETYDDMLNEYELLIHSLRGLLSWESIEGVPHRSISSVTDRNRRFIALSNSEMNSILDKIQKKLKCEGSKSIEDKIIELFSHRFKYTFTSERESISVSIPKDVQAEITGEYGLIREGTAEFINGRDFSEVSSMLARAIKSVEATSIPPEIRDFNGEKIKMKVRSPSSVEASQTSSESVWLPKAVENRIKNLCEEKIKQRYIDENFQRYQRREKRKSSDRGKTLSTNLNPVC